MLWTSYNLENKWQKKLQNNKIKHLSY